MRPRILLHATTAVSLLCCSNVLAAQQSPAPASANASAPRIVRGVIAARGTPLGGVNVFDIETLEGALTREDGRFSIAVADSARVRVHLVARAIGFSPLDTTVSVASTGRDSLLLAMTPLATLMPMSVMAGRYTATASPTTTLSPIEVANTPGSNADISGAIKTLPGVQNADEGSGIFVRGGDFTETHMYIDGAPLFSAYQFEAPTGSVAGTVNPFLSSSITFASGGFGAEWGNALSGIVDVGTQRRAARSYANLNASILGVNVGGALALGHNIGVAATAGMTNLSTLLDLNGNPRAFSPAPHGNVGSVLMEWGYRRQGFVKLFGLRQGNAYGVPVSDPSFAGTFASNRTSDVLVASWSDSIGRFHPTGSVSTSGLDRDDSKGSYGQSSTLRSVHSRFNSTFLVNDRIQLLGGFEVEKLSFRNQDLFPAVQQKVAAGAAATSSLTSASAVRSVAHISLDARPTSSTELIAGVRGSRSGFATRATVDPRVSFAWMPAGQLTVTASWGVYHQVADPAFLDRMNEGTRKLAEAGARMVIAGAQLGEGVRQARVEGWQKSYTNLNGLTRSYSTVSGLKGNAHGVDFFGRTNTPFGTTARVTWSLSNSRRTEPNTLVEAPAVFDVTSSFTAILQKQWKTGWSAGVAVKRATGRPFTDIESATYNAAIGQFVPSFGAPLAERLPEFSRTDVTVSKQRPFGANRFLVAFASINNVFNTVNTYAYTWSNDYRQRIPVRSTNSRTFFVGANLTLLASH